MKDILLQEVLARIDMIKDHSGPGTDVQVTGGDPTLRDEAELIQIGHSDCNRYSVSLTSYGKPFPMLEDSEFIADFMDASEGLVLDRTNKFGFVKILKILPSLVKSKGKMGKLTFIVHNFMDASQLECDRIDSCSFMVMNDEGPIFMCMHNAKRDDYILKPLKMKTNEVLEDWSPTLGMKVGRQTHD